MHARAARGGAGRGAAVCPAAARRAHVALAHHTSPHAVSAALRHDGLRPRRGRVRHSRPLPARRAARLARPQGLLGAFTRRLQYRIRASRLCQAAAGRQDRAAAHDPPVALPEAREPAPRAVREQPATRGRDGCERWRWNSANTNPPLLPSCHRAGASLRTAAATTVRRASPAAERALRQARFASAAHLHVNSAPCGSCTLRRPGCQTRLPNHYTCACIVSMDVMTSNVGGVMTSVRSDIRTIA